jgi:hypothetical protein
MLVQVKNDDLDETTELLASVIDVLMAKGFVIESFPVSLVIATVGFPFKEPENPAGICEQTARELTNKHSGKLKVLYANVSGRFGLFGHSKRMTYGPLVPRFDLILKHLVELNYGDRGEYRQP